MIPSRVVVCGNNTMDTVLVLDRALATDGKIAAISVKRYAGGQAANVAHALALLGLNVEYLGAFGDDDEGARSRASLERAGVSLSHTRMIENCPTHAAVVIVQPGGERTIIMHKPAALRLPAQGPFACLKDAALLFVDNHEPEAAFALAVTARAANIPVMADLEIANDDARRICQHLTSLIAPLAVIANLAGTGDPAAAVRSLCGGQLRCVVATDGANGAWGVNGDGEVVRVPAVPCTVTDTTGAGDAFHAGYIAAALHGFGFADALHLASEIAALKCEEPGPRLSHERLSQFRDYRFARRTAYHSSDWL